MNTTDGYILTVFHLFSHDLTEGAPVVFFQHGLYSNADTWIINEDLAPGFQTAKAGYDVWLGNNRGTTYSTETVEGFNKTDAEYYDYSFYELGKYDAPAQIDFVLEKTG